jgi:hypothetical protein
VETIERSCFSRCKSLSTVTFESGSKLISIDQKAFEDCSSLRSISIPPSVQTLSYCAFLDCKALLTVTFEVGSALTSFGPHAFRGCRSLASIWIPSSLQAIFSEYNRFLEIIGSEADGV